MVQLVTIECAGRTPNQPAAAAKPALSGTLAAGPVKRVWLPHFDLLYRSQQYQIPRATALSI